MSVLPPMPSDWSFVRGRTHDGNAVSGAMSFLAMTQNVLALGERTSATSWRLFGASVRLRWARHGTKGTIPIIEMRDHTKGDDMSADPTFEVSVPWTLHPDILTIDRTTYAHLVDDIVRTAIEAIALIDLSGPSGDDHASDLFDALHGLLGPVIVDDASSPGTFVLWLGTPWSHPECRRHDVGAVRRLTDDRQDAEISAHSPKVVECSVVHLEQGRRTAVTLSGCTWVGRRHFDPVASIRAAASMPSLAETFR